MAKALYYSPRLKRDLIPPLYHAAKSRGIPMTALASRLWPRDCRVSQRRRRALSPRSRRSVIPLRWSKSNGSTNNEPGPLH
jgi:hypothetical protein